MGNRRILSNKNIIIDILGKGIIEIIKPRKHTIMFITDGNSLSYVQCLFCGRHGYYIIGDMFDTIEDVIE